MAITVTEYDESVVLYQFHQPWKLNDLHHAQTQLNAMIESGDRRYTIIVDYTDGGQPPRRLISSFGTLMNNQSGMERIDRIISVGTDHGTIRAATAIFSRVFKRLDVAPTLEDALAMLNETPNT